MLPTQGPSVPVTSNDFSSVVSCETQALAFSKATSQPVPVMFAIAVLASLHGKEALYSRDGYTAGLVV